MYNFRVRHNFLIIVKENGMGTKSGHSLWADAVHTHGVRIYGPDAKKLGLSARDGAFYCIHKCIEDWEKMSLEEKEKLPDLPTDSVAKTFSIRTSINILGKALINEYESDSLPWS